MSLYESQYLKKNFFRENFDDNLPPSNSFS